MGVLERRFASVVVDAGGRTAGREFDYRVPAELASEIKPGSLVIVPFGGRFVRGVVVELLLTPRVPDPKPIRGPDPGAALADAHAPRLAQFIADRYACSPAEAYRAVLPPAVAGRTARVWFAPAAGPKPGTPSAELERIYDYVREHGPLGHAEVAEKLGLSVRAALERLGRLARAGYVMAGGQYRSPPRQAGIALYEATPRGIEALPALSRRAPAQARALRALVGAAGPLPRTELGAAAAVKSLVDRDYVKQTGVLLPAPGGGLVDGIIASAEPLPATPAQARAIERITEAVRAGRDTEILLFGVTGSGKTEVYLQAIAACFELGKQALVLVPEISLTPQALTRFEVRFPGRVAVLHSALGAGERARAWRELAAGGACIALGARSAVFAPLPRLGLIIVDEEHEASYKQEDVPRYDAREVARFKSRLCGAPVVFGSATPSLELYHRATHPGQQDVPLLLTLAERVDSRPLPLVELVDMRAELAAGNRTIFSRRLQEELGLRLERSEQAILLLNRRGQATFVLCRECGFVSRCPRCEVALVYHGTGTQLRCHWCGHRQPPPDVCPACGGRRIRYFGVGTERVEAQVRALFPACRVSRLDLDVAQHHGAAAEVLGSFARGELDVLVGTQMVGKGMDVPNVTLVGVVSADTALALPDFRAAERTFSLMTQVAGRAGRGAVPGLVLVQTYSPDHYSLKHVVGQDYEGFFAEELEYRRQLGYPPFNHVALLRVASREPGAAERAAACLADTVRRLAAARGPRPAVVLGPSPAPLHRLQGLYRWNIVVKDSEPLRLAALAARALRDAGPELGAAVRATVDVDPQGMF